MMNTVKMGIIGCGMRGTELLGDVLLKMPDVEMIAVCDSYADRMEAAQDLVKKLRHKRPFGSTNYMDLLNMDALDAVLISSSWETHVEIAIAAMRKGIAVALEVGGAYAIDPLWDMVRTQEATATPLMLMENCCFGRRELMVLNMVELGAFGKVVHCAGGYHHDLRSEIAYGRENRHYRLRNYLARIFTTTAVIPTKRQRVEGSTHL